MELIIDTEKDYTYSNFRDQNLAGTDWKGVDLTGCNFMNSILSGGKFEGCNLQFCNFREANMNGAHFDSNTKTGGSAWIRRIPHNANGKEAKNIPASVNNTNDSEPPLDEFGNII